MRLLKYVGAFFYDIIIVFALYIGFTFICLLWRKGVVIPSGTLWYQGALAILFAYSSFSYLCGKQTIGMRAWKVKQGLENTKG